MRHNFVFDDINTALPVLMRALAHGGEEFGSRAGMTKELMHVGITLQHPQHREIVLPSRKASVAAQIAETMWVLAGSNDIRFLEHYLPRAADFSDDGATWRSGYGPRLRDFHGVDQLAYVVETLKGNPGSRQAVINLWDPAVDTTPGKDVACNNWLSFSSRRGALDLHVGIRSNDAMWGWSGINAFEWSALLEIVAGLTGLEVGALHFSTTSFHLYETHWAKATKIANDHMAPLVREDSPAFGGNTLMDVDELDYWLGRWFQIEALIRTGQHLGDQVEKFPEPMLQSWLRVLQWYWSGDWSYLEPIAGTRLAVACVQGLKAAGAPQEAVTVEPEAPRETFNERFLGSVNALHADKHAAYGDSWKRRGEPGILGNIARKVDRIGSGLDTSDETQADTAVDLMVYLAKYKCWLMQWEGGPLDVEKVLAGVAPWGGQLTIEDDFVALERATRDHYDAVPGLVERMLEQSMTLAKSLWKG